ncbi:unnamed protein product [Heligmosomoides polygyrus]|uniref:Uncharacterized protein n=1 Tax=Heligmosomoides polygyrus TaxID=6339 RepID=A0A183GJP1_HELPZ|nr:unnamed protein product [Heligmosomoides polygyrus]
MKYNVVVVLGAVPQLSDPFSVIGDHQKPVSPEAYPIGGSRSFLEKINNVTKSRIGKELWIVRPRSFQAFYAGKSFNGRASASQARDEELDGFTFLFVLERRDRGST